MPHLIQVITSDNKPYHIQLQLLKRYSTFFDLMIDQDGDNEQQQSIVRLEHVSHEAFDYVFQFLQLHKNKAPMEIGKPVVRGVSLSEVMSEEDAELVERVCALGTQAKVQILNAVTYLRVQAFKTLLTYALMQKELQQPLPELSADVTLQQQIKAEIQMRINSLIEMENHIKRLQAEDFKQAQDF